MLVPSIILALASPAPPIVLIERFLPISVQTTVTSQCGSETVVIRMLDSQRQLRRTIVGIRVGDVEVSEADLQRLAATILPRDVVSASIIRCGKEHNLDEVEIVIDCGTKFNEDGSLPRFVGLTVAGTRVEIS